MNTTLAKVMSHKGFKLTQEFRSGNVAVYRKAKGDNTEWEVILVREDPHTSAEVYPQDMAWGTNGWSYPTLEEAMKKAETEVYLEETD